MFLGAGITIDYKYWYKASRPLFFVSIILLLAIIFSSAAISAHGAKRWLSIGGFDFQPSELAKLAIFMILAAKLAEAGPKVRNLKEGFVQPLVLVAIIFLLIVLQPNYSMATMIFLVSMVLLYAAGTKLTYLFSVFASLVPVLAVVALLMPYRRSRILALLDPAAHTKSSYQQLQALISLGNGGFWGTGLGHGTQKLGYLPMPFTDTIFAILGEEMGFVGTSVVILLFGVIMWRGLTIARNSPDVFGKLLAVAITVAIGLNAFVHIGVCIRLLPSTGQPLPLVSFGGTSLIMNLFALGILLNLSKPKTSGLQVEQRSMA